MGRQAFFTAQGKPFYSIGIQSHNSSSYMPEQLRETFHAAQLLEVNTVAVPVPWERYELEEGCFDDAFISRILSLAREYQLHLVLLWFGNHALPARGTERRTKGFESFAALPGQSGGRSESLRPHDADAQKAGQ